jgi:hypothetical protein
VGDPGFHPLVMGMISMSSYTPSFTIPSIIVTSVTDNTVPSLNLMDGSDLSLQKRSIKTTNGSVSTAFPPCPSYSSLRFSSTCPSVPYTPNRTVRRSEVPRSLDPITGILQVWYQNLLAEAIFFPTKEERTGNKRFSNMMSIFKVGPGHMGRSHVVVLGY